MVDHNMRFSWNKDDTTSPRVVLTAEDEDFDPITIRTWKEEGFQVSYLPFKGSRKEYMREIDHLPDPLELGEKYAIVGPSHMPALAIAELILSMMQRMVKQPLSSLKCLKSPCRSCAR